MHSHQLIIIQSVHRVRMEKKKWDALLTERAKDTEKVKSATEGGKCCNYAVKVQLFSRGSSENDLYNS